MLTSPERYSTSCNGQACQTKSVRVLEVRPGINSRAFKGLLSDSNLHSGLRERALHDFHPRGELSSDSGSQTGNTKTDKQLNSAIGPSGAIFGGW